MSRSKWKRIGQFSVLAILSLAVYARTCRVEVTVPSGVEVIGWDEAGDFIGEYRKVKGPVVRATYASHVAGKPTFLDIGRPFPQTPRFNVVIWGDYRDNFPIPPEEKYRGQLIEVRGRIREHEGTPQIIVQQPEAISIINH